VVEFTDYAGLRIRLTDERLAHILDHPEMETLVSAIGETLTKPDCSVQSASDEDARLYYRHETTANLGEKYICVVVKIHGDDAFVLTAYLTDHIKKGTLLWNRR